jgi:GT2 family glycosyltransferase
MIVDSGLFDPLFYGVVRGRSFASVQAAAEDFVDWGMAHRLSPNAFLDFASMPPDVRRFWVRGRVRRVLEYLLSEEGLARPYGPLFDPRVYQGDVDPGLNPLAEFLRTSRAGTPLPVPDGRRGRIPSRSEAEAVLLAAAREVAAYPWGGDDVVSTDKGGQLGAMAGIDWEALQQGLPSRVSDRTSVIIPTYRDSTMTVRAVGAVLDRSESLDVEVVVVDNGSPPHVALALRAEFLGVPGVDYLRLPRNTNFAGGSNAGFERSTGDVVVFLNNDTYVRRGWLPPLREALEDPDVAGAQSLLLYEDDTIQSAGTVFLSPELLPSHLLVGHPKEDALGVGGYEFSAVTAAAMAMRAADVAALRAFDEDYVNGFEDVDLCLRALQVRKGGFRVVPQSLVTHFESRTPGRFDKIGPNRRAFWDRWASRYPRLDLGLHEALGFQLSRVDQDDQPVPAAIPRVFDLVRDRADAHRLRWSIKLPSTPGHWGDDWGDTHFADALARGLRRLGHDVVTARYGAHDTAAGQLDNVSLALRGKYALRPAPGKLNVLWVISHPDEVEPDELDGFDLVFAASHRWSALMSARLGRTVTPLLQATECDPGTPSPGAFAARRPEALFVGSTHEERDRRLVFQAVEAGIPLEVHGRGWEELPPGVWQSDYVPNHELGELYRRHNVVLADHWPDMARQGFIANRVFDALAAGAYVISDEVVDMRDVLPPQVAVCPNADEIRHAFARFSQPVSDTGEALRAAESFAQTHSFDARAATLAAAVTHAIRQR